MQKTRATKNSAENKTVPARPMVDPALDDAARPWGYEVRSSVWLGLPFQPAWSTVTYDGCVYSGANAELCFFYGQPLRPLLALQKSLLEGWIPVVQHEWKENSLAYEMEFMGDQLPGEDETNLLNMVLVMIRNSGRTAVQARFAAAMRQTAGEQRWGGQMWSSTGGKPQFSADWKYEMTGNSVICDGRFVYGFPAGAVREAVPGVPYKVPFRGTEFGVTQETVTCMARYEKKLLPGQTMKLVFKVPRVAVPMSEKSFVRKIRSAAYGVHRSATVRYWKHVLFSGMSAEIPEPRVHEAFRANLVHMLMAARTVPAGNKVFTFLDKWPVPAGFRTERIPTSGLFYPDFFANDYVDTRLAYDALGHGALNHGFMDGLINRYLDGPSLRKEQMVYGWLLWPNHGQVIQSMAHHYLMSRDRRYARKILPKLRLAIRILKKGMRRDPYGLCPEVGPFDNEQILGHYTSHNLWGLTGLRSAIRLAREVGADRDCKAWQQLHDRLYAAFLKGLKASVRADGYVPTGLYKIVVGKKSSPDNRPPEIFNNEWENSMLAWPSEALPPSDSRVAGTLEKIHRLDFREGIMGYRNSGGDLHGYSGYGPLLQLIACGRQEQALTDLYYLLLHTDSTHGVWEQGVFAWSNRESNMATCHAWAAARCLLAIRNMLVMEHGGRAGLEEAKRDLHIFSVVSPAWAVAGRRLSFRNAVTEMGAVSAAMKFRKNGADVTIRARFHHPPRNLVLHIPYFVELTGFSSNAKTVRRDGARLLLSPYASRVRLTWRLKKNACQGTFSRLLNALRQEQTVRIEKEKIVYVPAPKVPMTRDERNHPAVLSFETVLEAYQHEYARRYAQFIRAGGKPVIVKAPEMKR